MGLLDRIAAAFGPPTPRANLRNWARRLASDLGAELEFDEDGDAWLFFDADGERRVVAAVLGGDRLMLFAPSNVKFRPGGLPRDVAAFLIGRNKELEFADWDAVENDRHAYFALEAYGRAGGIDYEALRAAVEKMVLECLTLDRFLRKRGY